MNDDDLKDQINELIRDEIQDVINDYVDARDTAKGSGLGFVSNEESDELKVNISNDEVDKLIKEYKKIKKIRSLTFLKSKNQVLLTSLVNHSVDIPSKQYYDHIMYRLNHVQTILT